MCGQVGDICPWVSYHLTFAITYGTAEKDAAITRMRRSNTGGRCPSLSAECWVALRSAVIVRVRLMRGNVVFDLVIGLLALAVVLVVLLMQLGLTREVVVLQEKVTAFTQLLLTPPVPSFLCGKLPKPAIEALGAAGFRPDGPFVIAFMRSGCSGCFTLATGIKEAVDAGWIPRSAVVCFQVDGTRGSKVDALMRDAAAFVADDIGGKIFGACEISATPAMLAVSPGSWEVSGHSVGGDAAWVVTRLEMARKNQLRLSPVSPRPEAESSRAST